MEIFEVKRGQFKENSNDQTQTLKLFWFELGGCRGEYPTLVFHPHRKTTFEQTLCT